MRVARVVCACVGKDVESAQVTNYGARCSPSLLEQLFGSSSFCRSSRIAALKMAASDSKHGNLVKAMAMRVKYRVAAESKRCSVELLAPHPYNRGGAYPSGNQVYLLARSSRYVFYSSVHRCSVVHVCAGPC